MQLTRIVRVFVLEARAHAIGLYTMFHKKTGPFVILLCLCFDSYELHEIFQKYIGGVACCEY